MTELTDAIRALYEREMSAASSTGEAQARWAHLERAHIVSQPYPWLHTRNHVAMFRLACVSTTAARRSVRWCGSSWPPPPALRWAATRRQYRAGLGGADDADASAG